MRVQPPLFLYSIVILFNFIPCILFVSSAAQTKNATRYDWEDYDYYQLLGLDRTEASSSIDLSALRKAYRQQAVQWHPDKLLHRKNETSSITKEESNARFARIAQAYQVLSNETERYYYDLSLQQQKQQPYMDYTNNHNHQQAYDDGDAYFYHHHEPNNAFFDPRAFFQEFFDAFHHDDYYQNYPPSSQGHNHYYNDDYHHQQQHHYHQQQHPLHDQYHHESMWFPSLYTNTRMYAPSPDRSWQVFEVVYHSHHQNDEILRVYETQEYYYMGSEDNHDNNSNNDQNLVQIQTWLQEYVPVHNGFEWVYAPLMSFPILVSEMTRPRNQLNLLRVISTPTEETVLTEDDATAVVNGPFRLILTRSTPTLACALQVIAVWNDHYHVIWSSTDNDYDVDDDVDFFMTATQKNCIAHLTGSQIQVTLDNENHIHNNNNMMQAPILWSSTMDWQQDENTHDLGHHDHVALLDSDASLAVYRVQVLEEQQYQQQHYGWLIRNTYSGKGPMAALKRFLLSMWLGGRIVMLNHDDQLQSHHQEQYGGTSTALPLVVTHQCIWASGPAGCWRLGRVLVKCFRIIQLNVLRLLDLVDSLVDRLVVL